MDTSLICSYALLQQKVLLITSVKVNNEFSKRQKQMNLPENSLFLDCPARWNSTYDMFEQGCGIIKFYYEFRRVSLRRLSHWSGQQQHLMQWLQALGAQEMQWAQALEKRP